MNPPFIPAFSHIPRVRALFTTRQGGCSNPPFDSLNLGLSTPDKEENVRENWRRALTALGMAGANLFLPKLVHGDKLIKADLSFAKSPRPTADAIFTDRSGYVLAVTAADCLPVLIVDPRMGTAAAVHAGWKGSHLGIVEKCLAFLFRRGLALPQTTFVAFGPCIGRQAYEIGNEVARGFPPECIEKKRDRVFLDLPKINVMQIKKAGIPDENFEQCEECTFSNPDRYYSHRRDGRSAGRMAALICLD